MVKYDDNTLNGPAAAFPISVRVPEACRLTGIGRSKLYELIGEGRIETVKIGSMTLVLTQSLRKLVEDSRT
ncbi:helix-turn-helix domain-containing protein [Novosphingobium gossypii]|uniref:helix-turn-helix domain-containing protein n=1 Tax=Novosphingobium gossypii TaxID=1604774 RepID=UPI003D215397